MLKSLKARQISLKEPVSVLQAACGVLVLLNLVAGWFVFRPFGGSAESLEREAQDLRVQLTQRRTNLQRTKVNVQKVERGRVQGDDFMEDYFLNRRTAASTILSELTAAAKASRLHGKVNSFNEEPIEGSDTLAMMMITGEAEGTYPDLIEFINRLDRSPRLLIMESLAATPQQGSNGVLNIGFKLDAFVREDGGMPLPPPPAASSETATAPPPAAAPIEPAPLQPVRQEQPAASAAPPAPVGLPFPPAAEPGAQVPRPAATAVKAPIPVNEADAARPSSHTPMRRRRVPRGAEEEQ